MSGWAAKKPGVEAKKLAAEVAASHGFTLTLIRSPDANRRLAHARQAVMHALHETGLYSYPGIGQFLNRDHSTVHYGVRAHERRAGL